MAAGEVAEHLGLAPVHAQQVGGAGHVDVEEGAAHEKVGGLGGDVLRELGQALRRNYAGQPTFAAATHQVGHGAEGQLAGAVGNLTGNRGGEQLRLVDHHQHRVPVVPLRVEQAAQEGGGGPHLLLDIEAFEIEHHGNPVLADACGDAGEIGFAARGLDHHV